MVFKGDLRVIYDLHQKIRVRDVRRIRRVPDDLKKR